MNETFNNALADAFLDYFNNFLTIDAFASHYGMGDELANCVIEHGRFLHELRARAFQREIQ